MASLLTADLIVAMVQLQAGPAVSCVQLNGLMVSGGCQQHLLWFTSLGSQHYCFRCPSNPKPAMVRTVVRNGVTRKPWGQGRAAQQRYQRNRTAFDVAQLIKARMDVDQVQMTGQLFPRGSMKKLANKELLDWVHTFNGRVWTKPMLKQIIRVLLRTIDVPMDPSKTFGNFVNQQSKRLGYLIRQAKRLKARGFENI